MISDQEVVDLYRSLLGRAPEDASIIKAFQACYPNFDRGRKALFASKEFTRFYAGVTGRLPAGYEHGAATLALALLMRAGAALPPRVVPVAADEAVKSGMGVMFRKIGHAKLVVVVGEAEDPALDDLIPIDRQETAVLQIAPGFPPVVPLTSRLRDGATLFRLGGDPDSIAALLAAHAQKLEALLLLDRPATRGWVDALRPHFAAQTLVVVGRPRAGLASEALSAAIAEAHQSEPVLAWQGLCLHQFGGWLLPVTYAPPARPVKPPALARYPSLAIAAIVKNEAVCVENMLRSAAPMARFIAVLDTGSEDDTPKLVQAFLKMCGVPSAFAQIPHDGSASDFSAMRNAAIAMVPDDIDWVLMLDADEEIMPEDYRPILELAASGRFDAYALPRYNFTGADKSGVVTPYPDRQIRLLRHTADHRVRYEGVVHETVRGTPAGNPPLDASAIGGPRGGPHIHHLVRRFRTFEQEERKQALYRAIARHAGG